VSVLAPNVSPFNRFSFQPFPLSNRFLFLGPHPIMVLSSCHDGAQSQFDRRFGSATKPPDAICSRHGRTEIWSQEPTCARGQ